MLGYYILRDKEPVLETDPVKWAQWMAVSDRHVAIDNLAGFTISTVFLALDHSFGGGLPVLFETMVFHDEGDEPDIEGLQTRRYTTWVEAELGHAEAVQALRDWLKSNNVRPMTG